MKRYRPKRQEGIECFSRVDFSRALSFEFRLADQSRESIFDVPSFDMSTSTTRQLASTFLTIDNDDNIITTTTHITATLTTTDNPLTPRARIMPALTC